MGTVDRPHHVLSGSRAAVCGSILRSRRRRGRCLHTRACLQDDGLMSCVSAGRRQCGMVCPHWQVTSLRGWVCDSGVPVANIDYCSRETGLARGFAHYDDFSYGVFDTFIRYIRQLGRRLEASRCGRPRLTRGWSRQTGHWYDLIPRSKEHLRNGRCDQRCVSELAGKAPEKIGRPFFAFLNYNDAHTPYEVPDRSIPGASVCGPRHRRERQTLEGFTGIDKTDSVLN